jgi:hypothetical protein
VCAESLVLRLASMVAVGNRMERVDHAGPSRAACTWKGVDQPPLRLKPHDEGRGMKGAEALVRDMATTAHGPGARAGDGLGSSG